MMTAVTLDWLSSVAVAQTQAALLARAALDLPDVVASIDGAGIRLAAPGLIARLFGTRHTPRDPRLAWLTGGPR